MTISMPAWAHKLDDPDVLLGAHVNAMRGFRMCSQAQLGAVIGVGQSTMGKKLRGQVGITFAELLKFAEFFEVSIEDMIPPRFAGERVIGTDKWWGKRNSYTPRDSNPEPADKEPRRLRLVAA